MFATYDEIFEQRATTYHRAMETFPKAREAEFSLVTQAVRPRPGQVLCDMPAGGGYLRPWLHEDVTYIGVETTEEFASLCRPGPNDTILRSPLVDLDIETRSVDVGVSLAGVHHLPDRGTFFSEVHRILKPKSLFVLMDVESGTPSDRFLNGFLNDANSMGHKGDFLGEHTRHELEAAGFEILSDSVPHCPWRFPDRAAMCRFVGMLLGVDMADDTEIGIAIDNILGSYKAKDGSLLMNWSLRRLILRKQ